MELLGEFGITASSARGALGRLARRGLLTLHRTGRTTCYGLSEQAANIVHSGSRRIFAFGSDSGAWDGHWRIVVFSVPEQDRSTRAAIRTRLRWIGMAPLYDGVWVTPLDATDDINQVFADLDVDMMTLVNAPDQPFGRRHPLAAWDLAAIRECYERYLEVTGALAERLEQGRIGSAEALVARTRTMDAWRELPNVDPGLPLSLLPPDWPRTQARKLFETVYDGLGPLAEIRVRQVVGHFAPDISGLARHVRTSDFKSQAPRGT